MEDDEGENADQSAGYGVRVDEQEGGRANPKRPEHHTHPAKGCAEGRRPEHRHPEAHETDRQEDQSGDEHRIEYALGRLPQENERGLILGSRPGRMVEVGDRGLRDMWERLGRQNDEPQNAQNAPEERGRQALTPERTIQGEEMGAHKIRTARNKPL